jgi:Ca2+-binding RTX toxin-like protein
MTLRGMAGNDALFGGPGNDTLDGGAGWMRRAAARGDDIVLIAGSADHPV